jgi:hypothetical protein
MNRRNFFLAASGLFLSVETDIHRAYSFLRPPERPRHVGAFWVTSKDGLELEVGIDEAVKTRFWKGDRTGVIIVKYVREDPSDLACRAERSRLVAWEIVNG